MPPSAVTLPADTGVLLVGHGTRDLNGQAEFHVLGKLLAEAFAPTHVERCFLELGEPDIPTGVQALANRGLRRMIVAPVLLFSAGHAKADIPQAVAAAVEGCALQWCMAEPLGCHPAIVELSARRFREAIQPYASDDLPPIHLLLVGRGSSDPTAIAHMHEFAAARAKLTPVEKCDVGFLAVARPSLAELLEQAAALPGPRLIVVQPHLLFEGQLTHDIDQLIASTAAKCPGTSPPRFIRPAHLGPEKEVVAALLERIWAAGEALRGP